MNYLLALLLPWLGAAWPQADALFRRDPLFRGGDVATSVDLGHDRSLWLFGDSFVGKRRTGANLLRNAIAIQEGRDPTTARMDFFLQDRAFFQTSQPGQWLWPATGVRIDDKLLLTFLVMGPSQDPLGFQTLGTLARWIDNPQDSPTRWRHRDIPLPPARHGVALGAGALLTTDHELLAFSPVEPGSHDVHLIRWQLEDVRREIWSRPSWHPGPVFRQGQSEFSVLRRGAGFLAVQTVGFGQASIAIRTAPRPQGPWSGPQVVFTPQEARRAGTLTYAAKAHPQLAAEGLAITYCSNHQDFARLLADEALYFPRFFSLSPSP